MSLKIDIKETAKWKAVFDIVTGILDDIYLEASPEGIEIEGMDPSHLCMVHLTIPKEAVPSYVSPETRLYHVNGNDVKRILAHLSPTPIAITFDPKVNKLIFKTTTKPIRSFNTSLVAEGEYEETPRPDIDFNSTVKIATDHFANAIKDMQMMGDYATFTTMENRFFIETHGDSGETMCEFDEFKESPILKKAAPQTTILSVEYLADIAKSVAIADDVEIAFSSEMPCRFIFKSVSGITLFWFLAPRIEEEEDVEVPTEGASIPADEGEAVEGDEEPEGAPEEQDAQV